MMIALMIIVMMLLDAYTHLLVNVKVLALTAINLIKM